MTRLHAVLISLCGLLALERSHADSYYTQRPDDPKAIYLTREAFGVHGDGVGDDSIALQKAIDMVVATTIRGIVFVPEGRYKLSRSIRIWPGIRVIGYGKKRPVFVLADRSPGFQREPAYLFHFTGNIPGHPGNAGFVFQSASQQPKSIDFSEPVRDANPGTFYSALSNVDIVLGKGNPSAVAVRSTFAQHCFLAHMRIDIGAGLAGVHDGGNVVEDVAFVGGRYGIMTKTPSPGWQYTVIDTRFEGQRSAAIASEAAGLTLVRPLFRNVPTAVSMGAEKGEQLWIKDGRLENITGPALVIGNEHNSRNQINIENVVARDTPTFATYRSSGKEIRAPGRTYRVANFSHGLHIEGSGVAKEQLVIETRSQIEAISALPPPVPSDIAALPPQSSWVDVRTLGAKGDGVADDTDALRAAIDKHRALYFPMGAYRISEALKLKPDTALIGLHAGAVRIFLADDTPAFQGVGEPVAMIEAPPGGANIMIGLGVYTNGVNPRAVAVKWMSGEKSLMNDVRFLGGHGTAQLSGEPEPIYNSNKTADPDPRRRWDSQYPSLWVTQGGGGTFLDIWTPTPYAQAGLLVTDTTTPGRVYQMSSEHHVRAEVKLDRVANWGLYALQLEEERGESGFALPVEISRSRNITLANLFIYRVISSNQSFPHAVKVSGSSDIRFRGFHWWTNSKADFSSAVVDPSNGLDIRPREFATATLNDRRVTNPVTASVVLEHGTRVEKVADGFVRLAGGVSDPKGRFYAVDARHQRIYRWIWPNPLPEEISDAPLEPVNLATDRAGNLLVISHAGAVYALAPDHPDRPVQPLRIQAARDRAGLDVILPQNYWTFDIEVSKGESPKRPAHYVSPDGTTFVPAGEDFIKGLLSWGTKDHDVLRAYGMTRARTGERAYFTQEWHGKTFSAQVGADGEWIAPRLFVEQGGESLAVDRDGNVYIADGHIFVYDPRGKLIEIVQVPERPHGLTFGGEDGRTLFICAGESLYAARIASRVGHAAKGRE